MIHNASAAFTQDAFTMGIIDHQHQVVGFGDIGDLVQWREVAIHREHAVCDDQTPPELAFILTDHSFQ